MSKQEVTCLRCGQVEIDCVCSQGFCANVYDRITELEQEVERLKSWIDRYLGQPDGAGAYDEFNAMREEVERLRGKGWQPIETALKPQDKQRVLVCFIDDVHHETWHFDNSCCQVATYRDRWNGGAFELYCESINGYICVALESSAVTHWMPLPDPPEEIER